MIVRFLPPAEEEMTGAALFYEMQGGRGVEFLDEVQRLLDLVSERPRLGPETGDGFRQVHLRRFPFTVVYLVEDTGILVAAVAHQRRAPNYWRTRE